VGVEIVLHEYDLRDVGEVLVRQVFENLRIIDGGVAICDPGLRRGRLSTWRQPSSGANIMNRLAVPPPSQGQAQRSYS
jgi:hypothetical protein